jgi:hypothetical protein
MTEGPDVPHKPAGRVPLWEAYSWLKAMMFADPTPPVRVVPAHVKLFRVVARLTRFPSPPVVVAVTVTVAEVPPPFDAVTPRPALFAKIAVTRFVAVSIGVAPI